MMKPERGEYVDVDGIKTFYIRTGKGQPVVLIHGGGPGGCSSVNWKLNIEPLAASGFQVIAYDQPGFGLTENPQDYSLEFRVTHAKAFIKKLQLDGSHLIGNSQGCYIAARVALEHPKTQRLVLVSSGTLAPKGSGESEKLARQHSEELSQYEPTLENARALTLNTLFNKELVTDEMVEERLAMSSGKNFEAQLRQRKTSRPRPIHDELRNLRARTLILWGKNDRGAAVERGLLLFQLIPAAEMHIFDRCGHWVQWDQAARFNRLVGDFLKAAENRGTSVR